MFKLCDRAVLGDLSFEPYVRSRSFSSGMGNALVDQLLYPELFKVDIAIATAEFL
jgi:hypothetical protein